MRHTTTVAVACWAAFALTAPVQAVDISWTNTTGGFWQDGGNWNAAGVAPSNNFLNVNINNAGSKTVTINGATPAGNLTITNLTVTGSGTATNTLLISNAGSPLVTRGSASYAFVVGSFGALTITNSTLISTNGSGAAARTVGLSGGGGLVTLQPGGTWYAETLVLGQLASGTGTINVAGGQLVVSNSSPVIGNNGVGILKVSNGGTALVGGALTLGNWGGSQGTLIIDGGTVRSVGGGNFGIGSGSGAIWLINGELDTRSANVFLSNNGQVTVSNGLWRAAAVYVQYGPGLLTIQGGTNLFSSLTLPNVNGTGTLWLTGGLLATTNGTTTIGNQAGSVGLLTVSNGTWLAKDIALGGSTTAKGTLTVAGGQVAASGSVTAGKVAGGSNNTVTVTGGLLEANTLKITAGTVGNVISNSGGVYQFTSATPTITPASGSIAINGGTISFRAVTNVNVKGNWSGTQLTNMTFAGTNTFRLDAATNATSPDQSYTFEPGLGATNYTRLELYNGSMYRGGSVMIGDGGSLMATGGVSMIGSNLTFQSGATCQVWLGGNGTNNGLRVGGDIALGGATMDVRLTATPQKDSPYVIIANDGGNPVSGNFAASSVTATFEGRTYRFSVSTLGGDGNDVAVSVPQGTVFVVH